MRVFSVATGIWAATLALDAASQPGATPGAIRDPKAAQKIVASAETADPLALMMAGAALVQDGQIEQGVFWFYAGQLRARYSPKLQGENAQIATIYTMTLGEQVNARAFKDIPGLQKKIDAVIAWDEKTFRAWAVATKLDPNDPALRERRRTVVAGLGAYKKELSAQRAALEQHARDYKTPAEQEKAMQAELDRKYSTKLVEVKVAGTRYRLPANYLSPFGEVYGKAGDLHDIGFWIFLPAFGGYTKDNWREPNGNPNAILVRVKGQEGRRPEAEVEAFLSQGGHPVEKVGRLEAAVYDSRSTRAPLPVSGTSRHYVLKGTKARGGPYYVVCDAPQPNIQSVGRCEMFLGDGKRNLRISALFRRDHLDRMGEIEERLSSMLASWTAD